jgi:ubiquinone/menaquinone biosynthesis C-methylase UbiE
VTANSGTPADVDACFGHLVDVLNSGMLALMISVGDRTGLFGAMRSLPASTAARIAATAGLNERYVREWLAAMTAGGIVAHDPVAMTFELPLAYAEALSRGLGGPSSVAGMCQHVGMLGKVEDRIVDHFRRGGGVPYETYEELWAGDESYELDTIDPMATDHVLSLLPGITERLGEGIDVADVGCGWGAQLNLLARQFPASRFVGFELYEASALRTARLVADHHGLTNVRFQQKDATTLDGAEEFDLVLTFDAIHDQARPDLVLAGIARSLKPGGVYVGVDISGSSTLANNLDDPLDVFKYAWSVMYCLTVSLAYGGMGLGTVWGEELARTMMAEAGFSDVRTVHLPGNLINCYHLGSVD